MKEADYGTYLGQTGNRIEHELISFGAPDELERLHAPKQLTWRPVNFIDTILKDYDFPDIVNVPPHQVPLDTVVRPSMVAAKRHRQRRREK